MLLKTAGALFHYLSEGGMVMWPLAALTVVLWFALGYRYALLRRGNRRSVRVLVEKYGAGYNREPSGIVDKAVVTGLRICKEPNPHLRKFLDDAFSESVQEAKTMGRIIRGIVVIAPLLGLLGTVTGMIETFNSLSEGALYTQTGGIAAGISEALLTTQMGLVVAVPGLVIGRVLDRREATILRELDQIKDLICPECGGANA